MSCLFCSSCCTDDVRESDKEKAVRSVESSEHRSRSSSLSAKSKENGIQKGGARSFTFRELAAATKNFRAINLIGEGGFGSVFKGRLESEQIVAVKQLNLNGLQGTQEFMMEVLMLSMLHHPNLVTLIGYCIDGDQKLLVYEFMPQGNLEDHLFDIGSDKTPLSWSTRIKIAAGAARGLEYLHCKASPPVIYRDLKSANILLDANFNPKLSDFGLAKLAPVGANTHVSTRVMGTYGYCAPEYAMSGKLTLKSDIYSFGVVLMELITGRKALDPTKQPPEQNLVTWVRPLMKDKRKYLQLVDPLLRGQFAGRSLQHTIAVAGMCLQENANFRPLIGDIVVALEYLASQSDKESQSAVSRSTPSASPLHRQQRDTSSRERDLGTFSS